MPNNGVKAVVALLAAAFSGSDVVAQDRGSSWLCLADTRWICLPGAGCERAPDSGIFVRFDFSTDTYERCSMIDNEPCDQYQAVRTVSGEFLNMELPGRATFAKIGPTGEFTEVVTLGQAVLLSYGQCVLEPVGE